MVCQRLTTSKKALRPHLVSQVSACHSMTAVLFQRAKKTRIISTKRPALMPIHCLTAASSLMVRALGTKGYLRPCKALNSNRCVALKNNTIFRLTWDSTGFQSQFHRSTRGNLHRSNSATSTTVVWCQCSAVVHHWLAQHDGYGTVAKLLLFY